MMDKSLRENEGCDKQQSPVWPCDDKLYSFSDLLEAGSLKLTSETVVKTLYSMARALHDTFTEAGIHYWITGGTALGCVRHQGIIPWDDDVDFCILEEDEGKLVQATRLLNEKGFELIEAPKSGYKVFHKTESVALTGSHECCSGIHYPFGDVLIMTREGDYCFYARSFIRNAFPSEFHYTKDIENVERRPFGDFYLNCPTNVEEYLSRFFGEKWRTQGATQFYDHAASSCQGLPCLKKFILEEKCYEPARPFN